MDTAFRRQFLALVALLPVSLASLAAAEPATSAGRGTERYLGKNFAPLRTNQGIPIAPVRLGDGPADTLRFWNEVAVNASGLDHTPVADGEARVFGEQLGPGRASRAMAIVHIAMFDAANAILGGYRSYTGIPRIFGRASTEAAIAQAAHDTLVAVFPSQRASFDELLRQEWTARRAADRLALWRGIAAGRLAAAGILKRRRNDGTPQKDPLMDSEYVPSDAPGAWRQDPISLAPIALGKDWGRVRPFVMRSGTQFRAPAPPPMDGAAYAEAFDEVRVLGGDGDGTPTLRTPEQTEIGIYWAYDGTPSLCAPPRLYNQIAREISKDGQDVMALARLLALVHTAMADAGIAIWESKYYYSFWRPVTGIREADEGTGPSRAGDGNAATLGDPTFSPLGAPASNLSGPNFTPPFPAYPSGHAGFGGALFQILRNVYGTDRVAFTFVSDELNGVTRGNDGEARPLRPRSFDSFSQAEEENGQSRIYLGIHWAFDKTEGIAQGRRVADYVYGNAFQRVR
jgi:hypothetical protein